MELDNFAGIESVFDFFNQSRHIGRIFINRLWNITNLFKSINKIRLFLIRTLPLALLAEIVTISITLPLALSICATVNLFFNVEKRIGDFE